MNVVAVAPEEGVRRHMHLDEGVARRTAADAGIALALEAQDLAVAEARRYGDVEVTPGRKAQPLLGAARRFEEVDREDIGAVGTAQTDGSLSPAAAPPG